MKLWDLMDKKLFHKMVADKYVRINESHDLRIIGYTEKAQFDNEWNAITLQCRGLVIDSKFNVLARPFDKFMNYGQNQADIFLMDHRVEVTDKMGGSLGILFFHKTWNTATRGSFISEQAYEMEKIFREKYNDLELNPNWTYLFEIIYPSNRIVLDYGDTRDLFLLGARHIETGLVRSAEAVTEWTGPKTTTYPFATLSEALTAPPRPNAEGYVVYFPDLDYRVKIKQEDYIALHKIVTGLTARRIWENMKEGKTLEDLLEIVPDEWHKWLQETYEDIMKVYNLLSNKILDDYEDLHFELTEIHGLSWTRKQFAQKALKYDYPGFMFSIYDNKSINDKVWDLVRPSAE